MCVDTKYLLGIEELDLQHEGIERICIALDEVVDDKDCWLDLLEKLRERLRFHFYAEESIMSIFAYPEAQEHKRSHLEIIRLLDSYKDTRLTDVDIQKLRNQPMRVFMEQILAQDMRFAAFIKRNKERLGMPQ